MKRQLTLISVITIVLVSILLIELYLTNKNEDNSDNNQYIIHYYINNKLYDIKTSNNKLLIIENNVIECIQAPCDPMEINRYEINYKDEYKTVIEKLCKDHNEITIFYNDVTKEEELILNKIVKEKVIEREIEKEQLTYNVLDSNDNSNFKEYGYYIEELDNKTIITIALGEKSTGGYDIIVNNININEEDVEIWIEEISPKEDDAVTQAFTYPMIQVEFNRKPNTIKVMNKDTKEELEEIETSN